MTALVPLVGVCTVMVSCTSMFFEISVMPMMIDATSSTTG